MWHALNLIRSSMSPTSLYARVIDSRCMRSIPDKLDGAIDVRSAASVEIADAA